MTPSDDLSSPRRPIFFPVVIATVFLTIIGLTAGFVLGEQRNNAASTEPVETTEPVNEPSAAPPAGKPCPPETIQTARKLGLPTDLRQVMKVVTDIDTTIWICVDPVDGYYYQSKTGEPDAKLEQGENGLFLSQVKRVNAGRYEGVDAKGTRFVVTRTRFEVTFVNGRAKQIDAVISWE